MTIKKEVRLEREKLKKQSINLRKLAKDVEYEKSLKLREEQNKTYQKWKFYDFILKQEGNNE